MPLSVESSSDKGTLFAADINSITTAAPGFAADGSVTALVGAREWYWTG